MITLTFSQSTNTVDVVGKVVYGTDFWDDRRNQYELDVADGNDVVYDNGPTICHGVLVMKAVTYAYGDAFRTWLRTYALWAYNTFTISAVANLDLGKGKNTQLTSVRYDGGASLKGVFTFVSPGYYDINFPYRFTR